MLSTSRDLLALDDEGRRNDCRVAGGLEMQPVVEQLLLQRVPPLARDTVGCTSIAPIMP